jgi:vanillate/4-hydroxybenzoate decarboxylase subunit D
MANPICPRCRSNATAVRAQSPAAGVWSIFGCNTCFYTWRSTEPAANTDPDQYPQVFRLNPAEFAKLPEVPAIAPLRQRVAR